MISFSNDILGIIGYEYDNNDHLLSRKTYLFTTQSDLSGMIYNEHTYAYGDSN
jgi:hypothetical protein